MHHSNIVPVYGTGDFDGSHYLVMQLVDGDSLDKVLVNAEKAMEVLEVADLGVQIADAIAYAHDSGVLHRDIKPANIIVESDGLAQITDFGLATTIDNERTRSRALSGSLRYLAPERLKGVSDQRSDVYSIGLTLYEMLVGRPAFQQDDTSELLLAVANPSSLSIRKNRSEVPLDLETIGSKRWSRIRKDVISRRAIYEMICGDSWRTNRSLLARRLHYSDLGCGVAGNQSRRSLQQPRSRRCWRFRWFLRGLILLLPTRIEKPSQRWRVPNRS